MTPKPFFSLTLISRQKIEAQGKHIQRQNPKNRNQNGFVSRETKLTLKTAQSIGEAFCSSPLLLFFPPYLQAVIVQIS